MGRMFRSLDLLVLSCLFATVISEADEISPPQNFTLQWFDEFTPELSWTPPDSARNCKYTVITTSQTGEWLESSAFTSNWKELIILGGRSLSFSVTAVCNGKSSKSAFYNISYPELVKNLSCHLYARRKARCQWTPASDATKLKFFYQLKDEVFHNPLWSGVQECPSYISNTEGVRTGCELEATRVHVIYILFNETVNKNPDRNTFEIMLKDNVKPPPLNWTVVKSKNAFNISWSAPDILKPSEWKYKIKYTACGKTETRAPKEMETSYLLVRNSHCDYNITIQAVVKDIGKGATPWSDYQYFDKDLDVLAFAAVIVPCVVAILAALMFVCCRKNKNKFFPPIITPVDFITDIDNNNKCHLYNFQAPAEEEKTCEITVLDPEIIRLDC